MVPKPASEFLNLNENENLECEQLLASMVSSSRSERVKLGQEFHLQKGSCILEEDSFVDESIQSSFFYS